jgi:AraC-like DNA-binding protein
MGDALDGLRAPSVLHRCPAGTGARAVVPRGVRYCHLDVEPLLDGPDGTTASAVALAAGFGDLSHFNRSFRRRYGATPSDVRAAGRGQEG